MYLIDTNVFLEILLKQDKSEISKNFLDKNKGSLKITDFSLHSIGLILLRNNKVAELQRFIIDVLPKINILTLPLDKYKDLIFAAKNYNLDFDDAYQYLIAKTFGLEFVTMDKDFEKIQDITIKYI